MSFLGHIHDDVHTAASTCGLSGSWAGTELINSLTWPGKSTLLYIKGDIGRSWLSTPTLEALTHSQISSTHFFYPLLNHCPIHLRRAFPLILSYVLSPFRMYGKDWTPSNIPFLQSYLKISSGFLYSWVCWTYKVTVMIRCLNVAAAL